MQSKRLLILEHDRDVARMLEEALKDEGFDTISLVDDQSFVTEVRKLQPDLVIIDILGTDHEPDHRVLDALRADHVGKCVPVITMGTSARMGKASIASYTASGFLLKPFDLQELYDKIYRVIGIPTDPCGKPDR